MQFKLRSALAGRITYLYIFRVLFAGAPGPAALLALCGKLGCAAFQEITFKVVGRDLTKPEAPTFLAAAHKKRYAIPASGSCVASPEPPTSRGCPQGVSRKFLVGLSDDQ